MLHSMEFIAKTEPTEPVPPEKGTWAKCYPHQEVEVKKRTLMQEVLRELNRAQQGGALGPEGAAGGAAEGAAPPPLPGKKPRVAAEPGPVVLD